MMYPVFHDAKLDSRRHVSHFTTPTFRAKLIERMRKTESVPAKSLMLFRGGVSANRDETDHEPIFRQESTFHYLFGVREPDCLAAIDLNTETATLYVPRLPAEYATWMGNILPPSHFQVHRATKKKRKWRPMFSTIVSKKFANFVRYLQAFPQQTKLLSETCKPLSQTRNILVSNSNNATV